MIRCEEGHFYDPAKHSGCPWCTKPINVAAAEPRTQPLRPAVPVVPRPQADAGVTRRLDLQPGGVQPVVGWLVCVDGPDKGKDYRLHSEKNSLGRSPAMDICIAGDESISRESHAVITFEPRARVYWLQPGTSSGLVYRNGEMVHSPVKLEANDVIEAGKSKWILVPFSSSHATW